MAELERTRYFLTEDEFSLCCAAAGIANVCCFRLQQTGAPPREAVIQTVFSMAQRGLLRMEGEAFTLCRELSDSFRLLRESRKVVLVYQGARPTCLLYGDGAAFAALRPGLRPEEYAGLALYRMEELAEWLADAGLALPDSLPDDLLAAVREDALPPVEGAGLAEYLEKTVWPGPHGGAPGPLPAEIAACVEGRWVDSGRLLARMYLVRQPLYDRLLEGTAEGVADRICRTDILAERIRNMLGEMEG